MSLKHYNNLSSDFEKNWFFSEDYFPTLSSKIVDCLGLKNDDVFGDFGCGTGNYTQEIVKQCNCNLKKVVGVDFSAQMIEQFKLKNSNFNGYCSDLESFVESTKESFDKILLKEVIHHVEDYKKFYSLLGKTLYPNGKVLIITRPQKTNFPFFQEALNYFSDHQVSELDITKGLKSAGFKASTSSLKINITISKERLFNMITNRFMSTFNHFTDQEIQIGIKEVDQKYPGKEEITFYDELLLIKGIK